jgi:hypothetical protein
VVGLDPNLFKRYGVELWLKQHDPVRVEFQDQYDLEVWLQTELGPQSYIMISEGRKKAVCVWYYSEVAPGKKMWSLLGSTTEQIVLKQSEVVGYKLYEQAR